MNYVSVKNLSHAYKEHEALKGIDFSVLKGEIFGFLGPNGSGKTTLFRILATVFGASSGEVEIDGKSLTGQFALVREKMGVVFQSPGLDGKLTVYENLKYHALFYGFRGARLQARCEEMLKQVGLWDRRKDIVEKLSGGLKRRVELAKGLLNKPGLLLLDEPSTGLDPGARIDLWNYLKKIQREEGVTVLVTTHLMDEAEHCDRIAIMNKGHLVKLDSPQNLKAEIGKDILIIKSKNPESLAEKVRGKLNIAASILDGLVMIEHAQGAQFVPQLVETFPGQIESVIFRKPTLEDVFVHHTGHQFWSETNAGEKS